MPYRPPTKPRLDRPANMPIRALDRKGAPATFRPGDTVRVWPEMGPGGRHPLDVDGGGFYVDIVRATYRTLLDVAASFDAPAEPRIVECVVLTETSWARCDQLEAVTP